MSKSIGQQLVAAREERGLSIEDVAHKTRIHHDVVRQLEADDYGQFPNPMFVRSFLSLYSRFLDFDSSEAITQLKHSAANQHGEQYLLGSINPTVREKYGKLTRRIPMRPIIASAAVIALLAVGGPYLVSHLYGAGSPTERRVDQPTSPSPAGAAAKPEDPAVSGENAIDLVMQPGSLPSQETSPILPAAADELPVEKIEINMSEIPKATVAKPVVKKAEPFEVSSSPIETDLDDQTGTTSNLDPQESQDADGDQGEGDVVDEEFLDPGAVTEE